MPSGVEVLILYLRGNFICFPTNYSYNNSLNVEVIPYTTSLFRVIPYFM